MKVTTRLFGEIEINPESVIRFPNGLVGFEQLKEFALLHEAVGSEPASYTLQSINDPDMAFQIMDPSALGFSYELMLSDEENAVLGTPSAEDVLVMLIVYRKEGDNRGLGGNFRAPLVINGRSRIGLQKVMETMRTNVTLSNLASTV